eukprot:5931316-Amphidinium_carterae.3
MEYKGGLLGLNQHCMPTTQRLKESSKQSRRLESRPRSLQLVKGRKACNQSLILTITITL